MRYLLMLTLDHVMATAIICGGFSLTFLAITAGLFFIGEIRDRARHRRGDTT